MLISIVILNYNYGRFLPDAIRSALSQDYPHVEVVVVDDGSTDNSREIIAAFGDKIVAIFKENGGQGSAVNAGFAAAHGELVIFLDADDSLLPHCCSTIAGMWRDDLVKVQFNLEVVDIQGKPTSRYWAKHPLPNGQMMEQVLQAGDYYSMPMSGNAFHRRYLQNVMPMAADKWRRGADVYMFIQAPFFGAIHSTDQALGNYRVHGINTSSHVKDGRVRIDTLRTSIKREIETNTLIRLQATRLGRKYDDALIRGLAHRQLIFLSARFDTTSAAPAGKGQAARSFVEFMAALLENQDVGPVKKLLIGIWMGAILCLPSRVAEGVFVTGYRRGAVFAVPRFIAPTQETSHRTMGWRRMRWPRRSHPVADI